jgi:RNA polymerase sigma-70 factor (ECF subfamily)
VFRRRLDPAPIEPLYRAHFDAIYRYASCRVGRDAALDVAAETFAQALRSLGRLDPDRDARAWLFGIAANVLRHHRRSEARRLRAYKAIETKGGADTSALSQGGGEAQQRERLVDALSALEAGDREALLLLAWADLSYDEIAEALGVPVGTVRSRIHRARRLLRSALTHDEEGRARTPITIGRGS